MRARSVPHNTILLTGALVAQKVLSFGYFWYLSSQLGKPELGTYLFALSFATLFASGNDLGLTPILIRESARDPSSANRYLSNVLGCKIILSSAALLVTLAVVFLSGRPPQVQHLVFFAVWFVFLDAFTISLWGMFKAAKNLQYESAATILVQLAIIAGGALVLMTSRSLVHLVMTLIAASAVNLVLAVVWLRRVLGYRIWPRWDPATLRMLLRLVPAFALSLVFVKIYNVADTVLLGYLADHVAVANYAIPAKVITALQQIIPATFAAVIFPVLTQQYRVGVDALSRVFERAYTYLIAASIPAAVALVVLAPQILLRVWPTYLEAAPALRIMALALPFVFLAFPTGYLLNACDRQRHNTINRGIVLAANLAGNFLLIPILGFYASALVFTLSNVLLLALDLVRALPLLKLRYAHLTVVTAKVLASSMLMAACAYILVPYIPLPAVLAASGLLYLVLTLGLKIWNWDELMAAIPGKQLYAKDVADQ